MFNKGQLAKLSGMEVYPASICEQDGVVYSLNRRETEKFLCLISEKPLPSVFQGNDSKRDYEGAAYKLKSCPLSHSNAEVLRKLLPFTRPGLVGLKKSVGMGDRLGLASPGHIRAVKGTGIVPVLAQQSIREMSRTERSADEVIDAATWGVFQEGFRDGFGSDADHLKTEEDIDTCLKAGFTMFTIDPGDHVDDQADSETVNALKEQFGSLPWGNLESSAEECRKNYLGKSFSLPGAAAVEFTEETLIRSAVKYLAAVAHTVRLYRYLEGKKGDADFELEMSVDETATPTSAEAHFLVAGELKRLGVKWVSLAPRFVGSFEKGVDYIGDLKEFERAFSRHAAIARRLGPYKISLHSGSDKFSVYPVAARLAGELVHVKTAGTSYLEALRVIAQKAPDFFRGILRFAFEHYETDRATYHVSAEIARVPKELKDEELTSLLGHFDARQMLHVTFGSVLTARKNGGYLFRDRFLRILRENEEDYYRALEAHLGRHIQPFV